MSKEPEYTGAFTTNFKKYTDGVAYNDFNDHTISFDPTFLELDSITDIYTIMNEINALASKIYKYGTLCDVQNRILQEIEDAFDMWKALTIAASGVEEKQFKSEKAKERFLMVDYHI